MATILIRIHTLPPHHPLDGCDVTELPMTSEDRRRVRRRVTAPDGQTFALELPTGTLLPIGRALHREGRRAYVVVAAPEEVLVVTPRTMEEAAFVGHVIGNLHRDIDIVDGQIIALGDAPLERRLEREGLAVTRETRPFRGKPPGEHSH